MLPGALGIALMSFTESIAAGRAFADPAEPPINADRELIATGAANLGGAFFGAMPAGGGTSQTAVVRAAGGRSQTASLVTASAAAATMLLLAPVLGLLPYATLAAVVIVYSVGLIQPAEFRAIRTVRTMEFRWALVACLGVLVFGTLQGIVVAIIVSLIGLASQTARPRVSVIGRKRGADVLRPLSPEHPDDETFEGLLIVRPEGRLFFVNAQDVAEQINALVKQYEPRVLALDLSRVPDIEYSALQMLVERERRASERGDTVWLVGMNPGVLEVVRKAGLVRATRPRAHAVQRARGDRALPGAAGNGGWNRAARHFLTQLDAILSSTRRFCAFAQQPVELRAGATSRSDVAPIRVTIAPALSQVPRRPADRRRSAPPAWPRASPAGIPPGFSRRRPCTPASRTAPRHGRRAARRVGPCLASARTPAPCQRAPRRQPRHHASPKTHPSLHAVSPSVQRSVRSHRAMVRATKHDPRCATNSLRDAHSIPDCENGDRSCDRLTVAERPR